MFSIPDNFDPTFLTADELDYELAIRNIQGFSGHRESTRALRAAMSAEAKSTIAIPMAKVAADADEAKICLRKAHELQALVSKAIEAKDKQGLAANISRLIALSHRLERITDKTVEGFSEALKLMEVGWALLDSSSKVSAPPKQTGTVPKNVLGAEGGMGSRTASNQSLVNGRGRGKPVVSPESHLHINAPNPADNSEELRHEQNLYTVMRQQFDYGYQGAGNLSRANSNESLHFRQGGRNHYESIPVHKWKCSFSGDGNGLSATKFLNYVEMYADSEGVSRANLLRGIHHLLRGKAADWLLANYSAFQNWNQFRAAFENHYVPSNYDYILLDQIRNRLQGKNESIASYVSDMKNLFMSLRIPELPARQVHIVRMNILPEYGLHLATVPIDNLDQLAARCKALDEYKLMMEHRPKENSVSYGSLLEPSYFLKPQFSTGQPRHFRKEPQGINEIQGHEQNSEKSSVTDRSIISSGPMRGLGYNQVNEAFAAHQAIHQDNQNGYLQRGNQNLGQVAVNPGLGANFMPTYLQMYPPFLWPAMQPSALLHTAAQPSSTIAAISQPPFRQAPTPKCFNCDATNHRWRDCPVQHRRIFCYFCGHPNVTTVTCPSAKEHKQRQLAQKPRVSEIEQAGNEIQGESVTGITPPPAFL